MTTLTEGRHAGECIASEGPGGISREPITVKSGENLGACKVLGKIITGTGTAAADAGNTGDGAMGAVTVGHGAKPGTYTVLITKAATNAGDFQVTDPDGNVVGLGTVAVAFAGGGLAFTLADGATDFAVGDKFTIVVTIDTEKYAEHDPAATDGSQVADAILFDAVDASLADTAGVGLVRQMEVNADNVDWITGITATQKTQAIAELAKKNIIFR